MEREAGVKKALSDFLQQHNLHDSVSHVDEIVLNYLLSILDDIGDSSNGEENVDAEQFCEMMAAYVPGFENISSVAVWEWMFSLSNNITTGSADTSRLAGGDALAGSEECIIACSASVGENGKLRSRHRGSNSQSESTEVTENGTSELDSQVAVICEMFPNTCRMEIQHCLSLSHGDMDETVQLLLHRQETGNTISDKAETNTPMKNKVCMLADKELKELTLARYSFVDTDDDKRTHKPPPLKQESKKLIRYREGQVVSTKGEKFSEVKKNETDEMKKTYVSLKPARKYRFH